MKPKGAAAAAAEESKPKKSRKAFRDPKDIYHLPLQEVQRSDVPAPRGGHTATMIGSDKVVLFGGYGGFGYSRRELSDLHYLDVQSMLWTEVSTYNPFHSTIKERERVFKLESNSTQHRQGNKISRVKAIL